MENCLKSKLEAVVNNDSLNFLGKLKVSLFYESHIGVCRFLLYQGAKVTVLSGTIYSDSAATTPIVSPKEITGEGLNMFAFYVKAAEHATILIENKYNSINEINRITTSEYPAMPTIDFSELASCFSVRVFNFLFIKTKGSLEQIVETCAEQWDENARTFKLYSSTVSGVTFHGTFFNDETILYSIKENGVVTVYSTRSGSSPNYTYGGVLATYNIASKTWEYTNS